MANNYQQSSSWLDIPEHKHAAAEQIIPFAVKQAQIDRLREDGYELPSSELSEDELEMASLGCEVELETGGVWFHEEENFNPESAETIARILIEKLELDTPFICTWANTCNKPRLDAFGGGGFMVRRGAPTVWVEAYDYLERIAYSSTQTGADSDKKQE